MRRNAGKKFSTSFLSYLVTNYLNTREEYDVVYETAFEKIMMIDTASVPIIKLEVNLKSLRKSHGLDEAMEERSPPTELVPEKANTYKVDIAFNEIEGTG